MSDPREHDSRTRTADQKSVNTAPETCRLNIQTLVHEFHGPVFRYCYRLVGTVADAEDLAQQTFLIAQQKLHQVREPDKVDRWLLRIARSCFLKECRKRAPVSAGSIELEVDEIPAAHEHGSDIDPQLLQQAIDRLPAEFKVVLTMFYFDELSYKEIAAQLELPMGTIMSRLSRAKSRLRAHLLQRIESQPHAVVSPIAISSGMETRVAGGDP